MLPVLKVGNVSDRGVFNKSKTEWCYSAERLQRNKKDRAATTKAGMCQLSDFYGSRNNGQYNARRSTTLSNLVRLFSILPLKSKGNHLYRWALYWGNVLSLLAPNVNCKEEFVCYSRIIVVCFEYITILKH